MSLTLKDAIALKAEETPDTRLFVSQVDCRIKDAIEDGKSSIINPHRGLYKPGLLENIHIDLTKDQIRSLRLHYETAGFTWTEHPDPDPGHPCSAPYTSLSGW